MEIINKIELKLKDFSKCSVICDSDLPLGSLYDFACALKSFAYEKVKEIEEAQKQDNQYQNKSEEDQNV